MKKELFLVVGVLGVLSLSACDARDEKQINAAIKDKSDAEIVQMVVDANKEETLTDVYSDGLKLDGEFKMKGDLAALESSSGLVQLQPLVHLIFQEIYLVFIMPQVFRLVPT